MLSTERPYTPAAGKDWLLPFYDLFTKLLGAEESHRRLLKLATIQPGWLVLDIGCGTGNLAFLAKRLNPSADVLAIDPDPKALSRARKKAHHADLDIEFRQAFSEQLPFPDASFHRVLSAFMLHHIEPNSRLAALREAYRVLKPGGSLHIVDFTEGSHPRFHHFARVHRTHEDSTSDSMISQLMQEAGFADAKEVDQQYNILGRLGYFSALRQP